METKGGNDRAAPASAEASAPNSTAAPAPARPPPPETLTEAPRRRTGGNKRKASGSASSSSAPTKRPAKERSLLHHVLPVHNGPCTRARQSPLKHSTAAGNRPQQLASKSSLASDAGGKGALSAAGSIKAEEEVVHEQLVDKEFEAVRSRGAKVHAVPTPAGWFSWKMVHPVEKHTLPSFFDGKSENRTPEVYMEIRNSIMKKFHSDPETQIELKDFSELSVGDIDARQEVFKFLDHWGLINFHPFPPAKSEAIIADAYDEDKTSSLVDKLYQFETIQSLPQIASKYESLLPKPQSLLPESSLGDDLVRRVGVDYHCNSCSADCSRKRYHCQTQADFDLCTDCFNDGKFGSGMARADFILMESAEFPGLNGGSWTDQETLLLLEALELFGENWNEIAEHVATKTKSQCILHFLQMPIEDSFIENDDVADDNYLDSNDHITENKEPTAKSTSEVVEADKKETNESSREDTVGVETSKLDAFETADEPMTSKPDSLVDGNTCNAKNFHEGETNFAIDALKAAFQAVGYFPEQGLGSFAEAGNPVMALAAFLSSIVEPDAVLTSCRSSLGAMSEDMPGVQLATRHCFILEDPPKDCKDPLTTVSSVAEAINKESNTDERKMQSLDATNKSKDEDVASVSIENEKSLLLQDSSTTQTDEKAAQEASPSKKAPSPVQNSVDQSLSTEKSLSANVNDVADTALTVTSMPSASKETEDLASKEQIAKGQESSDSMLVDEKLNSVDNSNDLASTDMIPQQTDSSKGAENPDTSIVLEGHEQMQTGVSTNGTKEKADDCERNEASNVEKNFNPTEIEDGHNLDRLKRAALTALSAASVKAKLLAKLEEDEVRRLISLIIDKQLHKLETKLSLFSDIESVVLRMREQTEKARHRLMFERSQIIAARLGVPPSSLRANQASLPANRLAMGYGTSGPRPFNMATQKQPPPLSRQ
ncbi:SWI/SNF complex subunit SWI3D-like [Zingiber officinale]|uniref:SWI/SNF complex subunit SWI3D-like n=1 Tax=Zingiber officinale TaxID=94328 RepID=UPI001C4B881A|nr:SWI/SNF complex subunit SWI3D-like [Zingiber officinale]